MNNVCTYPGNSCTVHYRSHGCTIDHMGVEVKICIMCMIRVSMCVSMHVSVHACWDTDLQLDNLWGGGGAVKLITPRFWGATSFTSLIKHLVLAKKMYRLTNFPSAPPPPL